MQARSIHSGSAETSRASAGSISDDQADRQALHEQARGR